MVACSIALARTDIYGKGEEEDEEEVEKRRKGVGEEGGGGKDVVRKI